MIYFPFKNYEEFKELFGVASHNNGTKSRKNKILLSLFKSKSLLHAYASRTEIFRREIAYSVRGTSYTRWSCIQSGYPLSTDWYDIKTMSALNLRVLSVLRTQSILKSYPIVANGELICHSNVYGTDVFEGLCEDGDSKSFRYVNHDRDGRVFKMRAGKFLRKLIEENADLDAFLPTQIKIWVCEEFAEYWKAIASSNSCTQYSLHVDDNFSDIYDSNCCKGNFGSCMVDDDNWTFYRDAVDAEAAYLTDSEGEIVARCVIYTNVKTRDGRTLRLAERQYASECDETLKRMLVMRLIDAGEIDGYKRIGADCHNATAFVDVNGEPFERPYFSIPCHLDLGDTVSYQDSFKWFDLHGQTAYNTECGDYELDTTSGALEGRGNWSEYNEEYIDEDDSVWIETRDDYFYCNQCVEAHVDGGRYREFCFEEDCIEIDGDYYYAGRNAEWPEDHGICVCPECDEYYVEGDGYYSELTGEEYCSNYCMENAEQNYKEDNWYFSKYDDEYFEDEDDIADAYEWSSWRNEYRKTTISKETLFDLVDDEEATFCDGRYVIDDIAADGEPLHYAAFNFRAA